MSESCYCSIYSNDSDVNVAIFHVIGFGNLRLRHFTDANYSKPLLSSHIQKMQNRLMQALMGQKPHFCLHAYSLLCVYEVRNCLAVSLDSR